MNSRSVFKDLVDGPSSVSKTKFFVFLWRFLCGFLVGEDADTFGALMFLALACRELVERWAVVVLVVVLPSLLVVAAAVARLAVGVRLLLVACASLQLLSLRSRVLSAQGWLLWSLGWGWVRVRFSRDRCFLVLLCGYRCGTV